jgi:hypothetical protein
MSGEAERGKSKDGLVPVIAGTASPLHPPLHRRLTHFAAPDVDAVGALGHGKVPTPARRRRIGAAGELRLGNVTSGRPDV